MAHLRKTVIGLFHSKEDAENALGSLGELGYEASDVSLIVKDSTVKDVTDASSIKSEDRTIGENILQGAAGGAATGGAIVGLTGLLAGIGAITVPGLGALFIGGPIAAALGIGGAAATAVSAATTGALAGGLVGAFIGLGLPRETAEYYETRIKEGGVILAVPAIADTGDEIERTFRRHNAEEIRTIN